MNEEYENLLPDEWVSSKIFRIVIDFVPPPLVLNQHSLTSIKDEEAIGKGLVLTHCMLKMPKCP